MNQTKIVPHLRLKPEPVHEAPNNDLGYGKESYPKQDLLERDVYRLMLC